MIVESGPARGLGIWDRPGRAILHCSLPDRQLGYAVKNTEIIDSIM
jgi:hypothetical protein